MEEVFNRSLAAIDKTIQVIERSILQVEDSLVCFSDFATKVAFHTRKEALERLDAF